ncbi:MAG: phosphate ABC transporter ATP-binding protein [Ignavibacteria bacterium]|nr:phosphate ABC transporter ATP-binding protein [Ignavibacteria bacterium]
MQPETIRHTELTTSPSLADGFAPNGIKMSTTNLNAFFGELQALYDVNMEIASNRVLAIIGPSGCGKSTFLRCLNRMHEVAGGTMTGSVLLDGHDIHETDAVLVRKRVGMVFQKPNPFPTMSIFGNVAIGLRLNKGTPRNQIAELVEQSLKQAALWDEVKDSLDKSGVSLSGGQQQRLCIARTLAVNPEVILMDEPASALDPIATAKIEELIYDLKKDYTIVIVTHNMQQAARVSDHTAFFYLGRLIEFDETKKLFTNPAKKQTEEYITGRFG